MTDKFVLASHQKLASRMLDFNDGLLIVYEAGTGKTASALDWIYRHLWMYYKDGDTVNGIPDALVVCPAAICGSWEVSIDKMLFFEGYTEEGVELVKQHTRISSFQKTYHTHKEPKIASDGSLKYKRVTELREDMDKPWGCVVVDESHGIGMYNSAQTEAAWLLADRTNHRIAMSGTPVAGGKGICDYSKLFGQIMFVHPHKWNSWNQYKIRYVTAIDKWFKPISYNTEACEQLLKDYAISARLEDCYDMPDYTDTMHPCPMATKARRYYMDFEDKQWMKYGFEEQMAGQQYEKMLQLCSGNLKRDSLGLEPIVTDCSKEDALLDILNGTDDKVCIFCNYVSSIDRICALIEKHRPHMTRRGKYAVKDGRHKGDTWKDFQFGDADIFIGQYQAGGVGLDLYASHTMVLYEPCRSSLLLIQTKARIMRKGQTNKCRYIYFYTPSTIEGRVWKTVRDGFDVTDKLMREWEAQGVR